MKRRERIQIFCRELWAWYAENKRTLPWRDLKISDRNQKAYLIWVSEVMLQQTQVSRVIPAFKRFIEQFPTIDSLSNASNRDVLIAWRGMGYNSRALRLRDGAKTIVECSGGIFPTLVEDLQSIKGIGTYTAGAIRNFAFDLPTPCIDTNIRRILHRFFVGPENENGTWARDDRYLLKLAEEMLNIVLQPSPRPAPFQTCDLLPRYLSDLLQTWKGAGHPSPLCGEGPGVRARRSTANWHAALMDFGALVCTKNRPKWEFFSLEMKSACKAYGREFNRTKKLINSARDASRREPGIVISGRFVPRRIIRGRIVEALRESEDGLTLTSISRNIIRYPPLNFSMWLKPVLLDLTRSDLIALRNRRYVLSKKG